MQRSGVGDREGMNDRVAELGIFLVAGAGKDHADVLSGAIAVEKAVLEMLGELLYLLQGAHAAPFPHRGRPHTADAPVHGDAPVRPCPTSNT